MSVDVVYNRVRLQNCTLEQFEQIPERDPSKTDQMFSRYLLTLSCLVTAGQWAASTGVGSRPFVIGVGSYDGADPIWSSAQEVANYVRDNLTADRQEFVLQVEGVTMLAASAVTDVDNGPKIKSFTLKNFCRESFAITWSVEIAVVTCSDGGNNTEWPVVSNRWSVVDSIDDTNRTTRRWQGVLRIAHQPDPAKFVRTAHLWRHLTVPPLLSGWRIGAMQFAGEPDGLTLGYSITHEQLACEAAPYPAVRMSIQHSRNHELAGGMSSCRAVETIACELHGAALVDRLRLIYRAQSIVLERGRLLSGKNEMLPRKFTVVESTSQDGCSVACTLVVEHLGDRKRDETGSLFNAEAGMFDLGQMGQAITIPAPPEGSDFAPYDPTRGIDFGPFGSGMGLLVSTLAAQWQTPCAPGHANLQGVLAGPVSDPPKPSIPQDQTTPQTVPTWTPVQPPDLPKVTIDKEAAEAIYTHSRIESELSTDHGWVALPKANTPENDGETIPASSVGVQLHAAAVVRIVRCQFERVGQWPKLWRPKKFDDRLGVTHWPLTSKIVRQAPEKLADDSTLYSVDAEYRFALSREYTDKEAIPTATLPWDGLSSTDTDVPKTAWREPDDQSKGIA